MIDMNGPDIEAVDELRALILNSGICQCSGRITRRGYREGAVQMQPDRAGAHRAEVIISTLGT